MLKRLNWKRFEEIYGVRLPKPLTEKQRVRAKEIGMLFEEMQERFGLKPREVFSAVAEAQFAAFLHDVPGCPQPVIAFCQEALRPGTKVSEHFALIKSLRLPSEK